MLTHDCMYSKFSYNTYNYVCYLLPVPKDIIMWGPVTFINYYGQLVTSCCP